MGVNISYMGTKRELAPEVVDVISEAQDGIALDVFAGMCSVGEAIGVDRQVWTNDIQRFSFEVGAALFTSKDEPLGPVLIADKIHEIYEQKKGKLEKALERSTASEKLCVECSSYTDFELRSAQLTELLKVDLANFERQRFSLFSEIYSNTYFGIRQSIEIDAIYGSIIESSEGGRISDDHRRWMIIGLGRAMLRISTSTGHFAQYLRPKENYFRTFCRQRRRSVWLEWLSAAEEMKAVGSASWRKGNRSFNQDCITLLRKLRNRKSRPSVIYADPPYTDDQYSRYYHVLETLFLYDYPHVTGAGRYRPDRFRTPFSVKSLAPSAMTALIKASSETGADLILSYPTNGLMYKADQDPAVLMKRHFKRVERIKAIRHSHSTFGASKGVAKADVIEQIFLGQQ